MPPSELPRQETPVSEMEQARNRLYLEVERLREALRRIVWAEHRGPDEAAESAYMVQVARDALEDQRVS